MTLNTVMELQIGLAINCTTFYSCMSTNLQFIRFVVLFLQLEYFQVTLLQDITTAITNNCAKPVSARFKTNCFKFILWDSVLVQPPVEEFSASVWNLCQPSIVTNLGNYWFVTPKSAGWFHLCLDKWQSLALSGLLCHGITTNNYTNFTIL